MWLSFVFLVNLITSAIIHIHIALNQVLIKTDPP